MKNLYLGLIAKVVFGFIGNAQNLSAIYEDNNLIQYLTNEYNFLKKCKDIDRLKKLLNDGKISENEYSEFYGLMNTNEKDYKTFIIVQRSL